MNLATWFRRALTVVALSAVAAGAAACSSSEATDPVGTTSSSLTVRPLAARDRAALAAQAGGETLHLEKGGKIDKAGVVYAAAPGASGRWGFGVVAKDGTISGFRLVDVAAAGADNAAGAGAAGGVKPATLHTLDDQIGGSSCDQGACNAATSAAAAAFADFVAASDDEFTALVYGLVWYSREVDKENACGSCG